MPETKRRAEAIMSHRQQRRLVLNTQHREMQDLANKGHFAKRKHAIITTHNVQVFPKPVSDCPVSVRKNTARSD